MQAIDYGCWFEESRQNLSEMRNTRSVRGRRSEDNKNSIHGSRLRRESLDDDFSKAGRGQGAGGVPVTVCGLAECLALRGSCSWVGPLSPYGNFLTFATKHQRRMRGQHYPYPSGLQLLPLGEHPIHSPLQTTTTTTPAENTRIHTPSTSLLNSHRVGFGPGLSQWANERSSTRS